MKRKRQRLAQRRKMAGYSQERLAEVLRVERSTVARWERAETEPQPWLRPRLAKVLGISRGVLAELLGDVVTDRQDDGDRLDRVLAQLAPADVDVARQLKNRIGQVAAAYETAPSASLLADARAVPRCGGVSSHPGQQRAGSHRVARCGNGLGHAHESACLGRLTPPRLPRHRRLLRYGHRARPRTR